MEKNSQESGGKITVLYSDQSSCVLDLTDERIQVRGFDKTRPGIQTVTIQYENKTTSLEIEVKAQEPENPNGNGGTQEPENPNGNGGTQEPENPNGNGGTQEPENPNGNGGTQEPENPNGNSGTQEPENPNGNGGTQEPENPNGNSGTQEPENPNENGGTQEPEKSNKDDKPIQSDLKNIKAEVTKIQLSLTEEKETVYWIQVTGIKDLDQDTNYQYQYTLSNLPNKKEHTYWLPISSVTREADGTYSIKINISETDMKLFGNLADGDDVYLYLKESAEKNHQTIQQVSNGVEVKTSENAQKQIEEAHQEVIKQIETQEQRISQGSEKDTTLAKTPIPQTGRNVCLGMIFIMTVILVIFYRHQYQTIDR